MKTPIGLNDFMAALKGSQIRDAKGDLWTFDDMRPVRNGNHGSQRKMIPPGGTAGESIFVIYNREEEDEPYFMYEDGFPIHDLNHDDAMVVVGHVPIPR